VIRCTGSVGGIASGEGWQVICFHLMDQIERRCMRTGLFILAGFLLLAVSFILSRLFSNYFPSAGTVAISTFLALWLALTGFNMWVGVVRAGYSAAEELPILLLLFGVPAAAAILIKWKLL